MDSQSHYTKAGMIHMIHGWDTLFFPISVIFSAENDELEIDEDLSAKKDDVL